MAKGEQILVFDGENYVLAEDYMEIVQNEIPEKVGVLKKKQLAREILKELKKGDPRVQGSEFNEVSKKIKHSHAVSAGPSLDWMIKCLYMHRMKPEGRRTFYMLTKQGHELAEKDIKDLEEEEKIIDALEESVEE